jgi:putative MATE family efflux protein
LKAQASGGEPSAGAALELTHEKLTSDIVKLALPAVGENLLNTMIMVVEGMLVGWLRDADALAAVGLGGFFVFLINSLFMALSIGATALVARAWGARDYERARDAGGQALLLAFGTAALAVALVIPLANELFVLMGAEERVAVLGSLYLRLVLSTAFFGFPLMVLNGVMRGSGDTWTPMLITLIMNAWNAVAAYGLIFGPGPLPAWEVRGAGIAAASAQMLGGCLALFVVLTGRTQIRVEPQRVLRWDREIIGAALRLSLPVAAEMVIYRTGSVLFMRMVSSLGTASLAAHQIAVNVESLSYMPGFGLTVAATTLVGQALGARKEDLAEAGIRRAMTFALVVMGSMALVFGLFGPQVVKVFGATPEVLALAGLAVRIAALEQLPVAVQMVISGSLRGAGDTRTPMVVTVVGTLLFRVLAVYLLAIALDLGLVGVWLGTAVDWTGRAILLYLLFQRGTWKGIEIAG